MFGNSALVNVWVVKFFFAYCGWRAMAGIDNSVVGQCKEFFFDAAHKRSMVASDKIGASDRALEQNIARENASAFW